MTQEPAASKTTRRPAPSPRVIAAKLVHRALVVAGTETTLEMTTVAASRVSDDKRAKVQAAVAKLADPLLRRAAKLIDRYDNPRPRPSARAKEAP